MRTPLALLLSLLAIPALADPARYALVDQSGVVQNVVVWDPASSWSPPAGLTPVLAGPQVSVCWTYQSGAFAFAACPLLPVDLSAAVSPALVDSKIASATGNFVTAAQAAAAAPVQTVNAKVGQVAIPTLCRQQTVSPLTLPTTNPASVSWTFPNTTCSFAAPPSCWMDLSTSSSGYVFDQPLNTARSVSAVTYSFTAHQTTLTISLGSLLLSAGPPANSAVTITCTAPPV